MKPLLISIIVPTHNRREIIGETIESVCAQTYQNWELIVVDDGSTDDTAALIQEYIQKNPNKRIKYLFQKKSNSSIARNLGIQASVGDYIQHLDSDDLLEPDKLNNQIEIGLKEPKAVLFGPVKEFKIVKGQKIIIGMQTLPKPPVDLLEYYLKGWWIGSCAFLWPRKVIESLKGWDESLVADQDGDLNLRALIQDHRFIFTPQAVSQARLYHWTSESLSQDRTEISLNSRISSADKAESLLRQQGKLNQYQNALAERYYLIAASYLCLSSKKVDYCFIKYQQLFHENGVYGFFLKYLFRTSWFVRARAFLLCLKTKLKGIVKRG